MAARIDRYFIVAGNHAEYKNWFWKNRSRFPDNNISDFIYVQSSIVLRGYANPHGFFIGTFRYRADLHEIVQTIIMCSHNMSNQDKTKLIDSILPPARPAP
jgi:hypothetical protein